MYFSIVLNTIGLIVAEYSIFIVRHGLHILAEKHSIHSLKILPIKGIDICLMACYNIKALKDRGIAQLVEQRSPKPRAEGSNPSAPANFSPETLGFPGFSFFFLSVSSGFSIKFLSPNPSGGLIDDFLHCSRHVQLGIFVDVSIEIQRGGGTTVSKPLLHLDDGKAHV